MEPDFGWKMKKKKIKAGYFKKKNIPGECFFLSEKKKKKKSCPLPGYIF